MQDHRLIQKRLAAMGVVISDDDAARLAGAKGEGDLKGILSDIASKQGTAGGEAPVGPRPDDESQGRPQTSRMPEEQATPLQAIGGTGTPDAATPTDYNSIIKAAASTVAAGATLAGSRRSMANAPAWHGGGNKVLDIPSTASVYGKKPEPRFDAGLAKLLLALRGR